MSLVTPSHQGGSSFAALELLANPQQLQNKIDQLKAAEKSALEQIALAGPAGEILQIRAEIDDLKDESTEMLQRARNSAEDLHAAAMKESALLVDEAKEKAEKILQDMATRAAKSEAAEKESLAILADAKKEAEYQDERSENLSNDRELLKLAETALEERENTLLQEKSKLATVREHIEQFLR